MFLPAAASLILSASIAHASPFGAGERSFILNLSRIADEIGARSEIIDTAIPPAAPADPQLTPDQAFQKVWSLLQNSPVPHDYVQAAFSNPQTQMVQEVIDRFNAPAEALPYDQYRAIFITPARISQGAQFYQSNSSLLGRINDQYGVDTALLVSFVGVETDYGANVGHIPVFNALYTAIRGVPSRSDWAANELAEFLKLSYASGFEPHNVLGSYAGAFGFGQFIPSSFNRYAVDFDGDGKKSFDAWPDVLATISNFEKGGGYQTGGDFSQGSNNWNAIFAYNHSNNYVNVVLELRQAILNQASQSAGTTASAGN